MLRIRVLPIPSFSTRASGGIGRRAGFRCLCPKGCGGSSPPSRTTQRAAARQNAAALQDAADHGETAIALRGGLRTVDAMPATLSLTQTRQLDVDSIDRLNIILRDAGMTLTRRVLPQRRAGGHRIASDARVDRGWARPGR